MFASRSRSRRRATASSPSRSGAELLSQRARGLPFELVFPTRNGTPRSVSNVNRAWWEIRGEDYSWVTPRTFRKTAVERGFGAEAAAKQLGHSSPEVTRKHYIDRAVATGNYTAALDALNPFPVDNRPVRPDLRLVDGG